MIDLSRRQFNFRAVMSAIVIVSSNVVGGTLVIMGTITWTEWGATVGIINSAVVGWIAKPDAQA